MQKLHASGEMEECIALCQDCFHACTETIGLSMASGGEHARLQHIRVIRDCAQICDVSAEFMMRDSQFHQEICGLCADICGKCAEECDRFDDDFMKECAGVCRRCEESCMRMSSMHGEHKASTGKEAYESA